MDDEIAGAGNTLSPEHQEALRLLAQIPQEFRPHVMAQKRQVATVAAEFAEIKAAIKAATDRVLRAVAERDRRDEEWPA